EVVVICVATFADLIKTRPDQVLREIATATAPAFTGTTPRPIASRTPAPSVEEKSLTVKVVNVHVGGDDSKHQTFIYEAPPGFTIKAFNLQENAKGGDAQYSANQISPTQ